MIGRIVEVSGEARYLSLDRGFMVVAHGGKELGRVPLDDIAGLICTAHGATYSNNLIVALATRGCPVVLCASNFKPAALVWPTEFHHVQAGRLDGQIGLSKPARNRLWQQIVRSKIAMQAATLSLCGRPAAPLATMVRKVKSGDSSNVEGQAARAYWTALFGLDFRRDPDSDGVNGLLNYGYAILRSTVARHLMGAGLHPGIPLHHANDGNPMRLVDDVMEPFRPLSDSLVWKLRQSGVHEVDAASKRTLALLPTRSLVLPSGTSPVAIVIQRLCVSLAQVCTDSKPRLALPPNANGLLSAFWDESSDEAVEAPPGVSG